MDAKGEGPTTTAWEADGPRGKGIDTKGAADDSAAQGSKDEYGSPDGVIAAEERVERRWSASRRPPGDRGGAEVEADAADAALPHGGMAAPCAHGSGEQGRGSSAVHPSMMSGDREPDWWAWISHAVEKARTR